MQGLLAEACQELVGAEGTVEVYGSSRTDSGVHATGNVCHVDLMRRHRKTNVVVEPHPADVVQRALNGLLEDKRPQVSAQGPPPPRTRCTRSAAAASQDPL